MQEPGQEIQDVQVEQAAVPTPLEVQLDSQKAIARIGAISQVIDGCAKASIQRTNPADWVRMGKGIYLQATGAQKIRPIWGIYFRDRHVTREDGKDGVYHYIVTGLVGSKVLDQLYGEVTIDIEGSRSSDDPFFAKQAGGVNPMDVRKAALANWESRAVTALLGLRNITAEDLKRNGVDITQVTAVNYQQGAQGGGDTGLISDAQRKRLYAIAGESKVMDESVKALLESYGYKSSRDIPRDKYNAIVDVIKGGPGSVAKKMVELAGIKTERQPGEDA